MLSYVFSTTTTYLKPIFSSIPHYALTTCPLSTQDDLHIPHFHTSPYFSSLPQHAIINAVLSENNLYSILGLPLYAPTAKAEDRASLRRAYLTRSRACHPDKFPDFPPATLAFQKVSVAYDVLSSASSKRTYDAKLRAGSTARSSGPGAEEDIFGTTRSPEYAHDTFHDVLGAVLVDFMEGDFELIRTFLSLYVPSKSTSNTQDDAGALNEINPTLNIGEESIENLLRSFRALRELVLVSQTYMRLIHLHLLQLLEIQYALRQLSYLDICGRLRLTLQLARVALEMPVAIDRAVCEREEQKERELRSPDRGARRIEKRLKGGILPAKLCTIICCLVVVLEHSEHVLR